MRTAEWVREKERDKKRQAIGMDTMWCFQLISGFYIVFSSK